MSRSIDFGIGYSDKKYFKAISPKDREFLSHDIEKFAHKYNLEVSKIKDCLNGTRDAHKGWRFNLIKIEEIEVN